MLIVPIRVGFAVEAAKGGVPMSESGTNPLNILTTEAQRAVEDLAHALRRRHRSDLTTG